MARIRAPLTKAALTEWTAIELLQKTLAGAGEGKASGAGLRTLVGVGDDAAVLAGTGTGRLVWTIDGAVENVHFKREWLSLVDVAYKATNAAVSDIAAMGARPVAALCHLVLPKGVTEKDVAAIGQGQAEAAEDLGCPVIGGNISSGPVLELVTTVLGECTAARGASAPLLRSGARSGDELWLIGEVGLAAAGLAVLRADLPKRGSAAPCIAAWRRPRALVAEGQLLRGRANSCLDVSDGLVSDARHLAEASDVAVYVDEELLTAVLSDALVAQARRLRKKPLDWALLGGEDYALLATGPAKLRPKEARPIGRIESGRGVWLETPKGAKELRGGFEHLSSK